VLESVEPLVFKLGKRIQLFYGFSALMLLCMLKIVFGYFILIKEGKQLSYKQELNYHP